MPVTYLFFFLLQSVRTLICKHTAGNAEIVYGKTSQAANAMLAGCVCSPEPVPDLAVALHSRGAAGPTLTPSPSISQPQPRSAKCTLIWHPQKYLRISLRGIDTLNTPIL